MHCQSIQPGPPPQTVLMGPPPTRKGAVVWWLPSVSVVWHLLLRFCLRLLETFNRGLLQGILICNGPPLKAETVACYRIIMYQAAPHPRGVLWAGRSGTFDPLWGMS